jgi:Zn-dependent protease with chaperone function
MLADGGLSALGRLGVPPWMPGRKRWLAWCWGPLVVSIVVWAAVVAADVTAGVLVILPVAQLILVGVTSVARRLRLRALLADRRYRTVAVERLGSDSLDSDPLRADTQDADARDGRGSGVAGLCVGLLGADVLRAAAVSGLREVTVRVGRVGGFARCFRAGDRAVLLVHERLVERPEAARFMIAHEAAHLARYDVMRRAGGFMTVLVCCTCLVTVWPAALVPGVLVVVAAFVGLNWTMELDCDRLAVRWIGLAAAGQAMALAQAVYRHSFWSLLSHPSPRRRLAACRAAARRFSVDR